MCVSVCTQETSQNILQNKLNWFCENVLITYRIGTDKYIFVEYSLICERLNNGFKLRVLKLVCKL